MSKRLDEEYKKMIASEVPDLWDRIEAKLPEKQAVSKQAETTETGTGTEEVKTAEAKTTGKKKPVIFKILPWIGVATAAALVLVIALPAILISNFSKKAALNATATPMYEANDMGATVAEETQAVGETDMSLDITDNLTGRMTYSAEVREKGDGASAVPEDADGFGFAVEPAAAENAEAVEAEDIETEDVETEETGKEPAGADDRKGMVYAKESGGKAEEVMNYYARVESILKEDGKTYIECSISENMEELSEDNEDKCIELYMIELSEKSKEKAEIGGIYRVEFDGDTIILLEITE